MDTTTGTDFFEELQEYHFAGSGLRDTYTCLRLLLERVCRQMTASAPLQFSNLFSRLNYVCQQTGLSRGAAYRIHTFRIHANQVLQGSFHPTEAVYLQDLKAICDALVHFYGAPVPPALQAQLPAEEVYKPGHRNRDIMHDRIRVAVTGADDRYIYAFDEDTPSGEPIRICYRDREGTADTFAPTAAALWKGCQLNLLDVRVDADDIYYPDLIVLEPDYLLDISALAECMKEYGDHPLNYLQSKFEPPKNTRHILLGNAANQFLDEFVNESADSPVVYRDTMRRIFRSLPFEFATCADLRDAEQEQTFFREAQVQFNNIRQVVRTVFPSRKISRENGILEPNFICEHLGVQGRLDFLQLEPADNGQVVIELKSGRSPFPENNVELIGRNHRSQAFLYQIVIQKVLGVSFRHLSTFILYSKYTDTNANLRLSQPYMAAIREIINIRNLIVAQERSIANDATGEVTRQLIGSIRPETLFSNGTANNRFLEQYIIPQLAAFKAPFMQAPPLALDYFYAFYTFVTKEHYISRTGDTEYDSNKGIASLWLSSLEDKLEAGEILPDLTILENHAAQPVPVIRLQIPDYGTDFLPNFRIGDIVVLYQRNRYTDNVTNKQVFKGAVEALTPHSITIRLRYRQRNPAVLPPGSRYAVEHDFLDASYAAMYRGLYAFLQADKDRQALLLHQRPPEQDRTARLTAPAILPPAIADIVLKAKMAKDYFLLIGPPGTGKTSIALKSMVQEFYAEPAVNLLLLSYTNRAVDEICRALDDIDGQPDYIRVGSLLSCEPCYRDRLLDNVIAGCDTREQVRQRIQAHRIFVGTVSSIAGKTELFRLKHFQVAIIDEASQILEPQLLGVLCAKDAEGRNAVDKFILIGDHKQLPAVVLQKEKDAALQHPALNAIGICNRRHSLFERLYRLHKGKGESPVWGMLHQQGRMHPDIMAFPNEAFYGGQLQVVPVPHQLAPVDFIQYDTREPVQQLLATRRLAFIPSGKRPDAGNNKCNAQEAEIVALLAQHIYDLYRQNNIPFVPEQSLGIITPYRSQMAMIRRRVHDLGLPVLNELTVDTVERFQGSQRDIIIYSFSVNQAYQLDQLAHETEEDGLLIDRKLNVALTRARKQLFITGNPALLARKPVYQKLIAFIRDKGGYFVI